MNAAPGAPVVAAATPPLPAAAAGAGAAEPRAAAAWLALAVLIVATVLASADLQLLILLTDPIKRSLGLSDTQIGVLEGAGLTLVAGLAAVPIGWLADRYDRRIVLGCCIVLWSTAAACCGAAPVYAALFAAVIGLGIGNAGVTPIVWGLIPEVFGERRRVLANSVYAFVSLIGTGLGVGLAGVMLGALDGLRPLLPPALRGAETWRLAYWAVALVGPLVALLLFTVRKRPAASRPAAATPTGAAANAAAGTGEVGATAWLLAHGRTMVGVFGTFGFAAIGVGSIQSWLPVVATRHFGASPAEVGQGIGAAMLTAALAGAGIGTVAVRWLQPRLGRATPLRVVGIGLAISALAVLALPWLQAAWQLYLLFVAVATPLVAATVLLPTLVQDIAPPAVRSRVTAVGIVCAALLSAASPVLVGAVSDALHARGDGLMIAVAGVSVVGLALGAVLARWAEPAFVRTVAAAAAAA